MNFSDCFIVFGKLDFTRTIDASERVDKRPSFILQLFA